MALWYASSRAPIDGRTPKAWQRWPNASALYCAPWSRVMDFAGGPALHAGHFEGVEPDGGMQCGAHGLADDPATEHIKHDRHVQKAGGRFVRRPQFNHVRQQSGNGTEGLCCSLTPRG